MLFLPLSRDLKGFLKIRVRLKFELRFFERLYHRFALEIGVLVAWLRRMEGKSHYYEMFFYLNKSADFGGVVYL